MDIQVLWIEQGYVLVYQFFCVQVLVVMFQLGLLYVVIDVLYFYCVQWLGVGYYQVVVDCYGDYVGQVVFVLGVVVGQVVELVGKVFVWYCEDVGVDFVDLVLCWGCVFVFDDGLYCVLVVMDDVVVVGGVEYVDGE